MGSDASPILPSEGNGPAGWAVETTKEEEEIVVVEIVEVVVVGV